MALLGPFVLARTTTYKDGLKTHSRHVLGAQFVSQTLGRYKDLSWFKMGFINIKLQTTRFSTVLQLQGRDPDRKLRIHLLYITIGGLGG